MSIEFIAGDGLIVVKENAYGHREEGWFCLSIDAQKLADAIGPLMAELADLRDRVRYLEGRP